MQVFLMCWLLTLIFEASSSIVLSDPFEPCYEEPEINIYIPNSFSPDNNEHNQTWFVVAEGISFENFTLLIFNRWGTLIWESHDIRVDGMALIKIKTFLMELTPTNLNTKKPQVNP